MNIKLGALALSAALCLSFVNAQSHQGGRGVDTLSASATFNLGDGAPEIGVVYCEDPAGLRNIGELRAYGSEVASMGLVNLVATGLPANSIGFFIVGETRGFVPNPANSQGDLCIGGKIGRFNGPNQIQNSGPSGFYNLDLDLDQFPMNPNWAVLAGETWCFQSWYRLPLPVVADNSDSDFTNAVEILFQ